MSYLYFCKKLNKDVRMSEGLTVLSLFDGISCGQIALERAGIKINAYYASEVDKYPMQVTMHHFPNTIQLGDITKLDTSKLPKIDLVIGGSPCTSFSNAGNGKGFDGESGLFWEFVRVLKEVKPKYFLLENVRMKKEWKNIITDAMGVEPIELDSALFSAQQRKRLYWTNIPNITQPEDKGILLKDIIDYEVDEKYRISDKFLKGFERKIEKKKHLKTGFNKLNIRNLNQKASTVTARYFKMAITDTYIECVETVRPAAIVGRRINENGKRDDYNKNITPHQYLEVSTSEKSRCLTTVQKDTLISTMQPGRYKDAFTKLQEPIHYRKLTPEECEKLQTIEVGYTAILSNTQRYKCIGNGWTIDVISHIFKHMEL